MITKITLNQVTSYKCPTTIETDKKVNLVYGLNGTGKSTLAEYLYSRSDTCFENCNIEGLNDEEVMVYNQHFVKDYFYEQDNLKGIFTLSKENIEAKLKITDAENEIAKLDIEKKSKLDLQESYKNDLFRKKQEAENRVWEIKGTYYGGDLEYCLSGFMGRKEVLFSHLLSIDKPERQPTKMIDELKKEVEAINDKSAKKYDLLPKIEFLGSKIEINQLFKKVIIGNENSTVANLINKLGNPDWVRKGLEYLLLDNNEMAICPFCQERTVSKALIENVKAYFGKSYEDDINELKKLSSEYESCIKSLPSIETYESSPFIIERKAELKSLFNNMTSCLGNNKLRIMDKLKAPSQEILIIESTSLINSINQFISEINKEISEHNNKIDNKETILSDIKLLFWNNMRWDYDQTIHTFTSYKIDIEKKIEDLIKQLSKIEEKINVQKQIIAEQQKKTVNIEEAIANINNKLLELGIDGFKIEKHSDVLYKIVRAEECDNIFQTLSEGEKMIISFLYFCELCNGKKTASSHTKKKIIVIDDPISSLSHIHIFNIGRVIKNDFFDSECFEQVFLLTHSLYFFYEMTEIDHKKREERQKLFRIVKNGDGSRVLRMKYEEIQNDYQSYWSIVKDEKQPAALIANCMRNIIEYFFNFIEKKDLNNVFRKPELKAIKYQAFYRYINRESHSLGQNIFDFKEFNYDDFKEAFRLVFYVSGYNEHYDRMIN